MERYFCDTCYATFCFRRTVTEADLFTEANAYNTELFLCWQQKQDTLQTLKKLPCIPVGNVVLDLVVIGCGPAGLALAAESAKLGTRGNDIAFHSLLQKPLQYITTVLVASPTVLAEAMGIKWVLHWQPNAGNTINSQILNEISQCAESINGVKEGRWKATLTFYKPMLREQTSAAEFPREFLGISVPEQPNKYYFVIRGQKIVLEAEQTIQTIMEKLQSYKTRVSLNFEGSQYQLGDFQLRVGKAVLMQTESLRGIVMEMEYLPISSLDKSRQIMEEFFDIWQEALSKRSLPGHFIHVEPNFTEYGLSDNYTSQHTAVQYAMVTTQLIASAQAAQAVRN